MSKIKNMQKYKKYVIFGKSKYGVPAAGRPYLRIFRYVESAEYAEYAKYAKYAVTSSVLYGYGHVWARQC